MNNYFSGNTAGSAGETSTSPSVPQLFSAPQSTIDTVLVAHAVIACLTWAFLVPVGALVLRFELKAQWAVRTHTFLQMTAYVAYIAAVGLGIWLVQTIQYGTFTMWGDVHPRLGLAIFVLVSLQPMLGYTHHKIYKRRAINAAAGRPDEPPGRTVIGAVHMWLGRVTILLSVINGGLGIKLADGSPYQTRATTKKAYIGYSVGVSVIGLLYVAIVVLHEIRRRKALGMAAAQRTAPGGASPEGMSSGSEVNKNGIGHNEKRAHTSVARNASE